MYCSLERAIIRMAQGSFVGGSMLEREQTMFVELGSLVKYKGDPDMFGIVLSTNFISSVGWRAIVQWNNNVRREDWISKLEVICK